MGRQWSDDHDLIDCPTGFVAYAWLRIPYADCPNARSYVQTGTVLMSPAVEAGALKKDSLVGPWRAEKPLGSGGQAHVWKARHATEKHCPAVALKICAHRDTKARGRFAQEMRLLSTHKHLNIVAFRESGVFDGVPYFAMECATTTLEQVAAGETTGLRLLQESPALLIEFFRQACAGVAHLHANNVLHRDIKPSNILLFLDPPEPIRAAVSDLGLGTAEDAQGSLTRTHETVGTPTFRAPDALYEKKHSKASDVYSLGKTLEFVFTRKVPSSMGPGKCSRDARMSDALWDELDEILRTACAVEPKERYQDAAALLAAIPPTVLTTTFPQTRSISAVATSLAPNEIRVLAEVIGATPSRMETPSIYTLQKDSRLSDYAFALGLQRLRMIGFVESLEAQGYQGEPFPSVRPTDAGLRWAFENREVVDRELSPPPETDEIPF